MLAQYPRKPHGSISWRLGLTDHQVLSIFDFLSSSEFLRPSVGAIINGRDATITRIKCTLMFHSDVACLHNSS